MAVSKKKKDVKPKKKAKGAEAKGAEAKPSPGKDPVLNPERPGASGAKKPAGELARKRQELAEDPKEKKKRGRPRKEEAVWRDQHQHADLVLPPDDLVQKWEFLGDMFAAMYSAVFCVLFGTVDAALDDEEMDWISQAWAAQLAVTPPENIEEMLRYNVIGVSVFLFAKRAMTYWAPAVKAHVVAWWQARQRSNEPTTSGDAPTGGEPHVN